MIIIVKVNVKSISGVKGPALILIIKTFTEHENLIYGGNSSSKSSSTYRNIIINIGNLASITIMTDLFKIYIVPLQHNYSEELLTQDRPKRNVLSSL